MKIPGNLKAKLGNKFPFLADFLLNFRFLLMKDQSQFGETGLLQEFIVDDEKVTSYYLELGSGHPITYSNSWNLPRSWIGIHVDPNQSLTRLWKIFRRRDIFIPNAITTDENIRELEYFKFPRRHSVLNSVVPEFLENWKTLGLSPMPLKVKAITLESCLKLNGINPASLSMVMCDIEGFDKQLITHMLDVAVIHPQWILVEDFNSEIECLLTERNYEILGTAGPTKLFKKIT